MSALDSPFAAGHMISDPGVAVATEASVLERALCALELEITETGHAASGLIASIDAVLGMDSPHPELDVPDEDRACALVERVRRLTDQLRVTNATIARARMRVEL